MALLDRAAVFGVRAAALGIAVALGSCLAAAPLPPPVDEYRVKAAFLYNFAKFVQWPAEAFQSSMEPITICILGHDPFGHSLEDTVAGRAIGGRPLIVRDISSVKQTAGCRVLFIDSIENALVLPMLAEIKTPGVLTVGESDRAESQGMIINFVFDEGKIRFVINTAAAEREKLRLSSRLLSLATLVNK